LAGVQRCAQLLVFLLQLLLLTLQRLIFGSVLNGLIAGTAGGKSGDNGRQHKTIKFHSLFPFDSFLGSSGTNHAQLK
jgi:hypothetical protein